MTTPEPIIDAWAQLPTRPEQIVPEARRLLERSGTAEAARPGRWVITNDEVAEIVAAHPDRFAGIAAVDLHRPVAAVNELRRAITQLGFKGLRVIPWLWDLPPDDRLYYPLYAACVELGVPFCTQVGHTGPAMPSEPGRPVPYLDRVAPDFPELTIVAGHIGHPWTEEMIGLAWKHDNVFIDTSAYAPSYYPASLLHFAATYGRGKVLFGTNFPQLPLQRCARGARELDLPAQAHTDFLAATARRVFALS